MFEKILSVSIILMGVCIAGSQNNEGEDKYRKISLRFIRDVGPIDVEHAPDISDVRENVRRFFTEENPEFERLLETDEHGYKISGSSRYDNPLFREFSLFDHSIGEKLRIERGIYSSFWQECTLPSKRGIDFSFSEFQARIRCVVECARK
jgi:hypothetical protein